MRVRVLFGMLVVWLLVGASCENRVLAVQIAGGDVTLAVGETHQLIGGAVTIGRASRDVTWSSVTPAVATVTAEGLVTAVAAGVTEITATSTYDPSMSGSIEVTVTGATVISNDDFGDRRTLAGDRGTVTGDSVDATKELGEPAHAGDPGGRSLWWSWSAPVDGMMTLDTLGSDFDTLLAVYTGSSLGALTPVAANDDVDVSLDQSRVQLVTSAGVTYQIAVDGYAGAAGAVVLNWAPGAVNNDFAKRVDAGPNRSPDTGTNVGATKQAGEPDHAGATGGRSVWWSWTAPASGMVVFDTFGSDFDTLLGVYTGSAVDALTPVVSNDDWLFTVQSWVTFDAIAGEAYAIAVDGRGGATGTIVLNWRPGNDDFVDRIDLGWSSGSTTGFNHDATRQPGEPEHGGAPGGRSVWWSWLAPVTGPVVFDTFGSDIDTVLASYTGPAVDALRLVAENDDAENGVHSRVEFTATQGVSYRIAVDVFAGPGGDIVLRWSPGTPNDDFADANVLYDALGTVSGSNDGATKEPGEPNHAGESGGGSLWWTWTAPVTHRYVFDTLGSSTDTLLAVYTGAAVDALTLVAENDDANGVFSRVEFHATAGVEYRIAVDGYSEPISWTRGIVLNWRPAP